ncbi:uncharacterized protein LOC133033852 isoform X1 [Cannabis sativa]|uniref:uncharacterized protein LOC133033852 isoform X1 n=1 Tax=Cannabis sativa TaxID=3483 RepID=UPI0029C9F2D7|nr:uncharacterized protein LOC133033852 isoform X1 [Cannabis sativa]
MADSAVSLDKVKGFLYAQYNDEEKWALNVVGERRRLSFSAKTQHRNCGNGNGDPPLLLSETLAEGLDTSLISLSVPKLRRRGRVSSKEKNNGEDFCALLSIRSELYILYYFLGTQTVRKDSL